MRLIASAVEMLEMNKHARWILLEVSLSDHKCGIGISWIFNTVFRYLPIFLTVLLYWVTPDVPLSGEYRCVAINNVRTVYPNAATLTLQVGYLYWAHPRCKNLLTSRVK